MKDEKLIRFFNTINFDEQFYSCFENASVKEVLLNKKINRMTLIIDIDNLPPIGVFCELCEKAQDLKGADSVRLKFNVLNNNKLFEDYFNYYFDYYFLHFAYQYNLQQKRCVGNRRTLQ